MPSPPIDSVVSLESSSRSWHPAMWSVLFRSRSPTVRSRRRNRKADGWWRTDRIRASSLGEDGGLDGVCEPDSTAANVRVDIDSWAFTPHSCQSAQVITVSDSECRAGCVIISWKFSTDADVAPS